jgi:hypothetical protein
MLGVSHRGMEALRNVFNPPVQFVDSVLYNRVPLGYGYFRSAGRQGKTHALLGLMNGR